MSVSRLGPDLWIKMFSAQNLDVASSFEGTVIVPSLPHFFSPAWHLNCNALFAVFMSPLVPCHRVPAYEERTSRVF